MHAPIRGWVNSKFQSLFFLAGNCHTPDGAWALLQNQRADLLFKIEMQKAQRYRRDAERIEIVTKLKSKSKAARLQARASAIEWNAQIEPCTIAVKGAKAELSYIDELLAHIEPHRLYSGMSSSDAAQECQHEEWCLTLIRRAENYLAFGPIPAHELETMRAHPDFEARIRPRILEVIDSRMTQNPELLLNGYRAVMASPLPKFLEGPQS